MCRHMAECPQAVPGCEIVTNCPHVEDVEYSYVGPVPMCEVNDGRNESDDAGTTLHEC